MSNQVDIIKITYQGDNNYQRNQSDLSLMDNQKKFKPKKSQNKKPKGFKNNSFKNQGVWTMKQNYLYACFLKQNKEQIQDLKTLSEKLIAKTFQKMAQIIGTRSRTQCKSHHQKMMIKSKNNINTIIGMFLPQKNVLVLQSQKLEEQQTPEKQQSIEEIMIDETVTNGKEQDFFESIIHCEGDNHGLSYLTVPDSCKIPPSTSQSVEAYDQWWDNFFVELQQRKQPNYFDFEMQDFRMIFDEDILQHLIDSYIDSEMEQNQEDELDPQTDLQDYY